jgi:hypothetical protein
METSRGTGIGFGFPYNVMIAIQAGNGNACGVSQNIGRNMQDFFALLNIYFI